MEAYVKKTNEIERRNCRCASYFPRTAAEAGYAPCAIAGSDIVSVTVSLLFSAPQATDGITVWLYVGDKRVARTAVTLAAGGKQSNTLFAAVYPSGREEICVKADRQGLLIEEMRVSVYGANAFLASLQDGFACDTLSGHIYMARQEDGYIYVYKYGADIKMNVAHGNAFDLCAANNALALLCSDDDGNLWGVLLDENVNETARVYLGDGFDRVAIGRSGTGFTLAAVKDKQIYLAQCEPDFSGRTAWQRAPWASTADSVHLCKQTDSPVLLYSRDGQIYAKIPVETLGGRDTVQAHISLVTGV